MGNATVIKQGDIRWVPVLVFFIANTIKIKISRWSFYKFDLSKSEKCNLDTIKFL
jgi:hypothetical protein